MLCHPPILQWDVCSLWAVGVNFGTRRTNVTMPTSSMRVWVTTASGAIASSAGRASASGSTTSEFRVAPLKTTARVSGTSSPVRRSRCARRPAAGEEPEVRREEENLQQHEEGARGEQTRLRAAGEPGEHDYVVHARGEQHEQHADQQTAIVGHEPGEHPDDERDDDEVHGEHGAEESEISEGATAVWEPESAQPCSVIRVCRCAAATRSRGRSVGIRRRRCRAMRALGVAAGFGRSRNTGPPCQCPWAAIATTSCSVVGRPAKPVGVG
jgi:hypothetical protein